LPHAGDVAEVRSFLSRLEQDTRSAQN